jgi:chromosomal replication initiator protein
MKINSLAKKYHPEPIDFIFITDPSEVPGLATPKPEYSFGVNYDNTNLNRNYTFNTFVVGPSNNFAVKAAMITAEQAGTAHNPLYIFGDVGLGKTHLMQAIGNYVVEKDINKKVLYARASDFVDDYVKNLKDRTMESFYEKYRTIDVLLIDDIQMMSGADKSQDEFFKVFELLYSTNKQIVVTSDKPAKELKNFRERIISRFEWGLSIDIQAPDLDLRVKILKSKLKSSYDPNDYDNVPIESLEYIAKMFTSNVRELEGALSRALTYCKINDLDFSVESFEEALDPLVASRKTTESMTQNNYLKIQSVVSDYYSVKVQDLIGKSRKQAHSLPRFIAMYLIKRLYDVPYSKIGEMFGNRDHSSVINACQKIENDLDNDILLKKAVNDIIRKLGVQK